MPEDPASHFVPLTPTDKNILAHKWYELQVVLLTVPAFSTLQSLIMEEIGGTLAPNLGYDT
jgi:hypothetical protein